VDKLRIWRIVISVGAIVAMIGIGIAFTGAGLDEEELVDDEWANVDNEHVYYLEMSCKGGKLVDMNYSVSAGFMTVQILTEEGLNQLVYDGTAFPSEVLLSRTAVGSGHLLWTPPETDKYLLAFYEFSQTGSTVSVTGTFTGASNTLLFTGIGIVAVGIIIAAIGAIKGRKLVKRKDAAKPQDVVMYPAEPPTETGLKELPKP
jgi:hypothetical protein